MPLHGHQYYTSGEMVPQSGLYLAFQPGAAVFYGKLAFDQGEAFPLCSRCDDVHYTLLRTLAPRCDDRNAKHQH